MLERTQASLLNVPRWGILGVLLVWYVVSWPWTRGVHGPGWVFLDHVLAEQQRGLRSSAKHKRWLKQIRRKYAASRP